MFILGSVLLGAGALLAPALPGGKARVGLGAALTLALVLCGALAWTMLFGWDTLVIDYLLFALVTAVLLGGTLGRGHLAAAGQDADADDADMAWPGRTELALFALAGALFALPVVLLPVPLDTDAQGFGYLALMTRLAGSLDNLAPFHPETDYLYAPGFSTLVAWLSEKLGHPVHQVMFAFAAVLGLINVWLAHDLGADLGGRRLGRAVALAMGGGLGLFLAYMDSHFTTLLALVFAQGFILCALRYQRAGQRMDLACAGLLLAAVTLSHPDTTVLLALGFGPWLVTMWAGEPRPDLRRWLMLLVGAPLLALLLVSPWLLRIAPLLGGEIVSPFTRSSSHVLTMLVLHGVWSWPLALIGARAGWRQRQQATLLALGWLLLCADFAFIGISERIAPWLPLFRYDYPFSIAWHGPIIPLSLLAGQGLLTLWGKLEGRRPQGPWRRAGRALFALASLLVAGALVFPSQLLAFSKGRVAFHGAFASEADVAAMTWLREHTPPDARVLNFPGSEPGSSWEGDWAAVISERDSVYYRGQPFFRGDEASLEEQERLRAFWLDPADPSHEALLLDAGIDYVLLPQIVAAPESFARAWRWHEPDAWKLPMVSAVAAAAYLERVFEQDGAQVYALRVGDDDG
ncbi:MAG: hypothetical protein J4G17_02705 [Anaerolineae bacterium]|nr:hypothetical protein [Anaerolineae bacterium]